MSSTMGRMKGKLTPESYLIDQEDYPRAVKQGTQRLEDVAHAYKDYVTEMWVAVVAVAVAVEREHPSDDWVSKGHIAAAAAAAAAVGHAGGCKQDCTARNQPAIAEDLHLLGSEEVPEMVGVPNLEGAAWVDMVA
jgi:hypothetical protein